MIENLLTRPGRLPLIAPSILSADFAALGDECAHVLGECGADVLHIDVMDGHFVPNVTMGAAVVKSLRKRLPNAFFDVHLMVTDPGQYIAGFADAGADHFTFHVEPAVDRHAGAGDSPLSRGYDPRAVAERVREAGMSAGLAVNPPTPVEWLEPYLDDFEMFLVMSVNPGFSGQAFIEGVLEKTKWLAGRVGEGQRVEMDGGVSPENAGRVRGAGCDVLVAASAIFGRPRTERAGVVRSLRG
ncbi:MAG: ribulose-phosphate 3-epimerase [Phycisphaerales bacterium]